MSLLELERRSEGNQGEEYHLELPGNIRHSRFILTMDNETAIVPGAFHTRRM